MPANDLNKAGSLSGSVVPPTLHPAATVNWTVVWWIVAPLSPDTVIV